MTAPRESGTLIVEAGTVFGFRTSPVFEDSPSDTGRYGAFVVLAHNQDMVALGVLDGVWDSMPTLDAVRGRELLRRNRFFHRGNVAAFTCAVDDAPQVAELAALGQVPLSSEQQRIAAKYLDTQNRVGTSFGSADGVSSDVEGEWRWANDREALQHEYELSEQRRERARAAAQERYETRLKGLTWEQLLSEAPFERWNPSPPFPPAEFRDAATSRVHDACRALQALGRSRASRQHGRSSRISCSGSTTPTIEPAG